MIRVHTDNIRILDTQFYSHPNESTLDFKELKDLEYKYFTFRYYRNNNRNYDYARILHVDDVIKVRYDIENINMFMVVHKEIDDIAYFL